MLTNVTILNSYTLAVSIEDKTTKFPTGVNEIDGKNIVGVFVTLQDKDNTAKSKEGKALLNFNRQRCCFVSLEWQASADTRIKHQPLESLSVENKNLPYLPVAIGKISLEQCEIVLGGYNEATDKDKVVLFTFIIQ